jgi:two-component system response regulator HydG/two-component system response regulator AtoC
VSRQAWSALIAYSYPGNVRELIHALERALKLARVNEIDLEHLPPEMPRGAAPADALLPSLSEATREFERAYLLRAVAAFNPETLAERLGLSRANLRAKLHWHCIRYADAKQQGPKR